MQINLPLLPPPLSLSLSFSDGIINNDFRGIFETAPYSPRTFAQLTSIEIPKMPFQDIL